MTEDLHRGALQRLHLKKDVYTDHNRTRKMRPPQLAQRTAPRKTRPPDSHPKKRTKDALKLVKSLEKLLIRVDKTQADSTFYVLHAVDPLPNSTRPPSLDGD